MRKQQIEVGKIINTHGLNGYVKVMPLTDDPTRFEDLPWVYVSFKHGMDKYNIEDIKYQKDFIIIKFKDINSINEAEKLKNHMLIIDRHMAVKLPENTYFICELIGLEVKTEDDKLFGKIEDVITTGSNDVYVAKDDMGKEILIPALKEVVLHVDIDDGHMIVKIPEGLTEI